MEARDVRWLDMNEGKIETSNLFGTGILGWIQPEFNQPTGISTEGKPVYVTDTAYACVTITSELSAIVSYPPIYMIIWTSLRQ